MSTVDLLALRISIDTWCLQAKHRPESAQLFLPADPDDWIRVLWLDPPDTTFPLRLEALKFALSRRSRGDNEIIFELFQARGHFAHSADLGRPVEAFINRCQAGSFERRLALSLAIIATPSDETLRRFERELIEEAHRSGDDYFRTLVHLGRLDRDLAAGRIQLARNRLPRTLFKMSSGRELFGPILQVIDAEIRAISADPEGLWRLLSLRLDHRLSTVWRQRAALKAAAALNSLGRHASALALKLDVAYRGGWFLDDQRRAAILLELTRDLVLRGNQEFALRNLTECKAALQAAAHATDQRLSAQFLEVILLTRAGRVAEARTLLEQAASHREMRREPDLEAGFAAMTLLAGESRNEEAVRVGRSLLKQSNDFADSEPYAAPLALFLVQLIRQAGNDPVQEFAALHDALAVAARMFDQEVLREVWFMLALVHARTNTSPAKTMEACREAERAARSGMETLTADRELLFRILESDTAVTTVLSTFIDRMIVESKKQITNLYELISTLASQAASGHELALEIERSNRRMARIVDSLPVIIWSCEGRTKDFAARHFDGAVEEIYQRPAAALRSSPQLWLDLIFERDRNSVLEALDRVERTLSGETAAFRICHKNGMVVHVEMRIRPLLGADPEEGALYGILTDVTDRRELEKELRQSHKMEALGRLAGGIAHEFNNILGSILAGVSHLSRAARKNGELSEMIDIVEHAAIAGTDLTARIRGFATQDTATRSVLDLSLLARETVELANHILGSTNQAQFEAYDEPLFVEQNSAALTQAVLSLIINARDLDPKGREIQLRTSLDEQNRPCLLVIMSGRSLDEDARDQAFDPYYFSVQSNAASGLGLSTVYRIMQEARGEVTIESIPGKATVVTLVFPRASATTLPHSHLIAAIPQPLTGRLLFVDDDSLIRSVGVMILESAGFSVTTAENGQEALEFFRRDKGEWILVVTDIRMPRLDGLSLVREIRRESEIPILIMTGYADEEPRDFATQYRSVDVIRKPFTANSFLSHARSLLGRST